MMSHKLDVFLRANVNEKWARVLDKSQEDLEDEADSVTYNVFQSVLFSWIKQGNYSPGGRNNELGKGFPSSKSPSTHTNLSQC